MIAIPCRIFAGRADQLAVSRDDATGEKYDDVEFLPQGHVVANDNGDLHLRHQR
jgi:hypothetical protein